MQQQHIPAVIVEVAQHGDLVWQRVVHVGQTQQSDRQLSGTQTAHGDHVCNSLARLLIRRPQGQPHRAGISTEDLQGCLDRNWVGGQAQQPAGQPKQLSVENPGGLPITFQERATQVRNLLGNQIGDHRDHADTADRRHRQGQRIVAAQQFQVRPQRDLAC